MRCDVRAYATCSHHLYNHHFPPGNPNSGNIIPPRQVYNCFLVFPDLLQVCFLLNFVPMTTFGSLLYLQSHITSSCHSTYINQAPTNLLHASLHLSIMVPSNVPGFHVGPIHCKYNPSSLLCRLPLRYLIQEKIHLPHQNFLQNKLNISFILICIRLSFHAALAEKSSNKVVLIFVEAGPNSSTNVI